MMAFVTLIFTFFIISSFSQANPIASLPQPNQSFNPNQILNQNQGRSCSYTVNIKTSCSSPSQTRDQISLAFGDAYGYQVYAPRLDDPYSRTFERRGYDGWVPESVTVSSYNYRPVSFYYNTGIPYGVWYGFDYCHGSSASTSTM
ncbi:hypothetical protein Lal_00003023 [Lupinus albus]|nr:hypothetical protein Lal_00003023 [Lupinus albus]